MFEAHKAALEVEAAHWYQLLVRRVKEAEVMRLCNSGPAKASHREWVSIYCPSPGQKAGSEQGSSGHFAPVRVGAAWIGLRPASEVGKGQVYQVAAAEVHHLSEDRLLAVATAGSVDMPEVAVAAFARIIEAARVALVLEDHFVPVE